MALEMGMNLVCSVLEEVVMCVCQYLFMSANAETIHRKKSGISLDLLRLAQVFTVRHF